MIEVDPGGVGAGGQDLTATIAQLNGPAASAVGAVGQLEGAAGDAGLAGALGALAPVLRQVGLTAVTVGEALGRQVSDAAASYQQTDQSVMPPVGGR